MAHATDAEADGPVLLTVTGASLSMTHDGHLVVGLTQQQADELTASLVDRQLNRWRDPDTDGPTYASSGVSPQLRGALAAVEGLHGEGAHDIVEEALEVWADVPEEHERHMTARGWPVN